MTLEGGLLRRNDERDELFTVFLLDKVLVEITTGVELWLIVGKSF